MSDTVWKVGCYRINPSTPSGQKFFILHMLVLPLIPITALVIQNSVTMNTLLGYQSRVSTIRRQVRGAMEIAVFIQNIQEERAEVALYIFTNQTNNDVIKNSNMRYERDVNNPNRNRMGIQERFSQTDRALEEVPTWPNVSYGSWVSYLSFLVDWQIVDKHKDYSDWCGWGWPLWSFQIQAEIPDSTRGVQVVSNQQCNVFQS